MSERAEFHVMSRPLDGGTLHYTASGLDYVYLLNGFTVEDDPDYGRITSIHAIDDLHRAIGLHIISQPRGLAGAEFRFLRKLMGFKQQGLAPRLGVDVQTVANYEKGKKIPTTSDRFMRVLFVLWAAPPDARAEVIKQLTEAAVQQTRGGMQPIAHRNVPTEMSPAFVKQWQMCVDCHAN